MRLRIREPAPRGSRFAPGAWDTAIGDTFDLVGPGGPIATGTLAAAEVEPDGAAAVLTIDFPDLETLSE